MFNGLFQIAFGALVSAFKMGQAAAEARVRATTAPELKISQEKVELVERIFAELESHGRLYWLFHPGRYRLLKLMVARARGLSWQETFGQALNRMTLDVYKSQVRETYSRPPLFSKGGPH